mgnify:CR=1 FL=1
MLRAMRAVLRHQFVPDDYRDLAYADRPLPIGYGQTISEPYIVALMTDLLQPQPGDRVLEIGTGSGYQAAVLNELTPFVYSIEIVAPLHRQASDRFRRLDYQTIQLREGDGYDGWPQAAPFDVILLTALLYFSGGPTNPFSIIYVVYIAMSAVMLTPKWTWAIWKPRRSHTPIWATRIFGALW